MHLLQVVFILSALLYSLYDGEWFAIFWKVVAGYFLLKLVYLNRNRFNSTRRMIQIATWSDTNSAFGRAVLNINVTKAQQYLASLQISSTPATLTDILTKAVILAVHETPDLRGNMAFGLFYPCDDITISLLLSNPTVEGNNIVSFTETPKSSIRQIAASRGIRTTEANQRNATVTQGFPGVLSGVPTSLMSLYVSLMEFVFSLRVPFRFGAGLSQVLLSEVGYVGEMVALMAPPPHFRGPLTICASQPTDEVVIDESNSPAIAQVVKLGISIDYRYITHKNSLRFLQRIKDYVESGRFAD